MLELVSRFQLDGTALTCDRYGSGHINQTYLVVTNTPHCYILQKINQTVFRDVPALMANVYAVTTYLARQDPDPRRVLTLVPTLEGAPYLRDEQGEYWRMYEFITGGICLDRVTCADDFYQSAVAFGRFQMMLAGFPAGTLHETIARFHDTPARFAALHAAVEADAAGRRAEVEEEIAFAFAQERDAGVMVDMLRDGKLPLRVTHNDTKLNNVILDEKDRAPLCVIDLDTVMPGLVANDFGDSIRFGASTALEDETDLSRVSLSLELYETYVRGFLGVCGKHLTPLERETLPLGAKLMTLENGIRFLADYLQGDVYYAIHRPQQNLDRARTQFKLIRDMQAKWEQMNEIIARWEAAEL